MKSLINRIKKQKGSVCFCFYVYNFFFFFFFKVIIDVPDGDKEFNVKRDTILTPTN